jgi:DNA invertase Pin-like site-specific DNA recombinase
MVVRMSDRLGYARVSTIEQDPTLQLVAPMVGRAPKERQHD